MAHRSKKSQSAETPYETIAQSFTKKEEKENNLDSEF
jgi:hypothetical protein